MPLPHNIPVTFKERNTCYMKYDYLVVGSGLYGAIFAHEAKVHGKSVLVVTHQGVLKAVLYHLLGRDYLPGEAKAFDPDRLQRVVCLNGVLSLDALDFDPTAA